MSKVVLKYNVSMLTCPSTLYSAYRKIHFRIMKTVNPLSQLYINQKFQKDISIATECLLWDLSLLQLKAMNGVISWYVLALQLKLLSGVLRSGLLQPLVINRTGLVQFGSELHLISNYLLELHSVEYVNEINISVFISQ